LTKALPYKSIKSGDKKNDYVFKNITEPLYDWGNDEPGKGAICGVDLEIPNDKHDYFKDFQLNIEMVNFV